MNSGTMRGLFLSGVLANGNAQVFSAVGMPLPATVWVNPANGDTVTVSYSLDNGVTYTEWEQGAATSLTADVLVGGVTNLKFQRTAGSGTTSTFGVC